MTRPEPVIDPATGLDARMKSLPHITLTSQDGAVSRYVPMDAHLALMDERDEYRRVVALINALRRAEGMNFQLAGLADFERQMVRLLGRVGEDDVSGDAMRALVAAVRQGDLAREVHSND